MASRQIRGLVAVYGALLVPAALTAQSEVRGRLVDSTGAPILGAVVTLPAVGFQVRADSNGRFAVAGQRGSSLRLLFSAPDYRTDSASVLLGRSPVVREFTLISNDAPLPEVNPSDRVVAGLVTDETGTPLSYANVQVNFGQRFMADDSGRFQVPALPTSMTLLVRRIGFEAVEFRLTERPDTALRITMKPIPVALKGVTVTGASSFRSLDTYGFYGRMKDYERGGSRGYFITPEDIDRRKPNWITQMVEGFPGIRVCGRVSITCPAGPPLFEVILGRNACVMTVYLDNIRITGTRNGRDSPVNELAIPNHIAGVEVYPSALNAPAQYMPVDGTCGVVLIWTK